MKRVLYVVFGVAAFLAVFFHSADARAQSPRTWVSSVGDDVNPCSRTAPCRTFAGALAKTAAGGEIDALDPGGHGTVTITKSITIDGTGTLAAVRNNGTTGIVISDVNGGAPNTVVVTLRGLSINGAGTTLGTHGIRVVGAARVNIEDTVISNQSSAGIDVAAGANVSVSVRNVVVRNVTGDGLSVSTTGVGAVARAFVSGSTFIQNTVGIHARNNAFVAVTRSEASSNSSNGVAANGTNANVILRSVTMAGNGTGLIVQAAGAVARIADCDIIGNSSVGVAFAGAGTVSTIGTNRITGNGTNVSGGASSFVSIGTTCSYTLASSVRRCVTGNRDASSNAWTCSDVGSTGCPDAVVSGKTCTQPTSIDGTPAACSDACGQRCTCQNGLWTCPAACHTCPTVDDAPATGTVCISSANTVCTYAMPGDPPPPISKCTCVSKDAASNEWSCADLALGACATPAAAGRACTVGDECGDACGQRCACPAGQWSCPGTCAACPSVEELPLQGTTCFSAAGTKCTYGTTVCNCTAAGATNQWSCP